MRAAAARWLPAAVACAVVVLLTARAAGADAQPTLHSPASVVAGGIVVLHARGFQPGSSLGVVVSPGDKGPCCAIRIVSTYFVSSAGTATLRFRMPLRYNSCIATSPPQCHKVVWARHERVVITATGYLEQAKTTTVFER